MPQADEKPGVSLGTAAVYDIVVQGEISVADAERLGAPHWSVVSEPDSGPVTVLSGRLRDQAELIGLLNALYEMRLPLLSVELVEIDRGAASSH